MFGRMRYEIIKFCDVIHYVRVRDKTYIEHYDSGSISSQTI